jgi:hypothetical protein
MKLSNGPKPYYSLLPLSSGDAFKLLCNLGKIKWKHSMIKVSMQRSGTNLLVQIAKTLFWHYLKNFFLAVE